MQTSQVRFTTGVRYLEVIGLFDFSIVSYALFFSSLAIYNCVPYMDNDKSVFVPLFFRNNFT